MATSIQGDAENRTEELSVIDCWNGLDAEVVLLRFLAFGPVHQFEYLSRQLSFRHEHTGGP